MSVAAASIPADMVAAEHVQAPPRGMRLWLLSLVLLVFAMVLVGGATRLTESGLSITEWNLVTGIVPPLDDAGWQAEFDRYRQTPQYEILNDGMSMRDFRTIYWWEWSHRELGRFIGLVYFVGLAAFVFRRGFPGRARRALLGIGLLLALQGLVGWIMVASGLKPGMIAVAPLKLTLHLLLAVLLFAALITALVRLGGLVREPVSDRTRRLAWLIVVFAFVQVALGGLVAGHDAGLTYNTWPLMDGAITPGGLWSLRPWWINFVANITMVQFTHRMGGYVLAALVLAWSFSMRNAPAPRRNRARIASVVVLAQVTLGIATLVQVVPIGLALMHQGMALVLIMMLVWTAAVQAPRGAQPAA